MDGCDSGPVVLEHFGESDYEYAVTVKSDNLAKLFDILKNTSEEYTQTRLLAHVRKRFCNEQGFVAFKELLEKNSIDFDTWSF